VNSNLDLYNKQNLILEDIDTCKRRIAQKEQELLDVQNELNLLYKQMYESVVYNTNHIITYSDFHHLRNGFAVIKNPDKVDDVNQYKDDASLYRVFLSSIFEKKIVGAESYEITDMGTLFTMSGIIYFTFRGVNYRLEIPFIENITLPTFIASDNKDTIFSIKLNAMREGWIDPVVYINDFDSIHDALLKYDKDIAKRTVDSIVDSI
jgi:hypothetical protein